jgi:hypothetical protein
MLSAMDRTLLDFERAWVTLKGPKDREIEEELGLMAGAYYERLLLLISDRSARAYDPLTLRRLELLIDPSLLQGSG